MGKKTTRGQSQCSTATQKKGKIRKIITRTKGGEMNNAREEERAIGMTGVKVEREENMLNER